MQNTSYYLGTLAFERKQWQEALGYYILSLAKWGTKESIACKLFVMIAWSNEQITRYNEALRVSNKGLYYFPDDGELLFRKAIALKYLYLPREAEACWKRVLELGCPKKFYSVDQGIYGHLTRHNLAIIAEEFGDNAEAEKHGRAILDECPGHSDALRRLVPMGSLTLRPSPHGNAKITA